MSAIQTNLWTCDICGATATTGGVTFPYSDPVVSPPDGWSTDLEVPPSLRLHVSEDVCDACPKCVADPNWDKYVERRSMPKYPDSIINDLGRLPRAGDWLSQCCLEDFVLITADDLPGLAESITEVGGQVFPTLDAALAWAVPDIQRSRQYTQEEIDDMVSRHRETERRFAAGEDIGSNTNQAKHSPVSQAIPENGGRPLDYDDTKRRVVEYLRRSVQQIFLGDVHAKIMATSESMTKVRIAAENLEGGKGLLAAQWLSELANNIANGNDVGKLTIDPDGNSTVITVRK